MKEGPIPFTGEKVIALRDVLLSRATGKARRWWRIFGGFFIVGLIGGACVALTYKGQTTFTTVSLVSFFILSVTGLVGVIVVTVIDTVKSVKDWIKNGR